MEVQSRPSLKTNWFKTNNLPRVTHAIQLDVAETVFCQTGGQYTPDFDVFPSVYSASNVWLNSLPTTKSSVSVFFIVISHATRRHEFGAIYVFAFILNSFNAFYIAIQ